MSIETEISRILNSRDVLRAKAVELGIIDSTSRLDIIANAFSDITNQGSMSATVKEGEVITIKKGYHDGTGTVTGVAGGGNYKLQNKIVTPTKVEQNITPDEGYYGLEEITVSAIPANFQDVSSVTATASDVIANKVFVGANGSVIAGTMANNGAVVETINGLTQTSYIIPKGYHSGTGTVTLSDDIENALAAI